MQVNINIVKGEDEIADFDLPMSDVNSFLDLIKRLGWHDPDTGTHYRVSEIQLTSPTTIWIELEEGESE